ncbi:DeoR faimly transcriptional regulator [Bacillus sp. SA1-12]|uniref:DeoR/GlpR family DNA-binding transcription regulator n=1 Tax=Bacillus sp. SA1-12 TaxID=1455638 RepID=UPI00062737C6|nr:DeoR/GlpR family DNA-binding transcription regulator [Bacillus sp. SA1-12]KKI89129.1 DeoR faimly transcriptional regulator [Bacillus sp. SA1-12]
MYQEERLRLIIDYLKKEKRISVDEICKIFDISRDTARRDLVRLEEEKAIIRTRGGAILPSTKHIIKDYSNRLSLVSEEKKRIGKKAAELINSGDTIILDTSTTVQACAEHLMELECTIVTNSINQADLLSKNPHARIQLLGGEFHKEHRYLFGTSVIEKLSQYHVDKTFIGCYGLSENGITVAHEEDGMVMHKMMQQADQVILLADHTKIGVTGYFRCSTLQDIDLFITDQEPDESFQELLKKHGVELLIAL